MILFVFILTVLAWGCGELVGRGINRYTYRQDVRRWLAGEKAWQESYTRDLIQLGNNMNKQVKEASKRLEADSKKLVEQGIFTPNEARYMRKVGTQKVLKAIAGRTDPITGQRIELYWERVGGHARFVEYRDGRPTKDWMVGPNDTFRHEACDYDYHGDAWNGLDGGGNKRRMGRRYM